jgi:hypothetical protein
MHFLCIGIFFGGKDKVVPLITAGNAEESRRTRMINYCLLAIRVYACARSVDSVHLRCAQR